MPKEDFRDIEEILDAHGGRLKRGERMVKTLYELGGRATAGEIASHLGAKSTVQVTSTLRYRKDVYREERAGDTTGVWVLEGVGDE